MRSDSMATIRESSFKNLGARVMALLSQYSCPMRTSLPQGPGRASPSRRCSNLRDACHRSAILLVGAFEALIGIARAWANECDHTSISAPDPIRTPQLYMLGWE